jgi:hypothetical protein
MKVAANVKDLAHRITREFHDMTPDQEIKRVYPDAERFVRQNWKSFIDAARKMIAEHRGEEFLIINGEKIDKAEAMALLKGLYHEAEECAGEFHGKNRSEKFRANWPDETLFAKANWKSFVQEARRKYAGKLGDLQVPEAEKRRIHLALVIEHEIAGGREKDARLQLAPNTQQFEGDKYENRKILEKFGKQPDSLKDLLMTSTRFH